MRNEEMKGLVPQGLPREEHKAAVRKAMEMVTPLLDTPCVITTKLVNPNSDFVLIEPKKRKYTKKATRVIHDGPIYMEWPPSGEYVLKKP